VETSLPLDGGSTVRGIGEFRSRIVSKFSLAKIMSGDLAKVTIRPLRRRTLIQIPAGSRVHSVHRSKTQTASMLRRTPYLVVTPRRVSKFSRPKIMPGDLAKHPILFLKVLDDVLLLPVQPSCQRHHQNLPRMCYHEGDSTVSKCRGTGPIHRIQLFCKSFVKQDLPCG
jgi:hypothetical protein